MNDSIFTKRATLLIATVAATALLWVNMPAHQLLMPTPPAPLAHVVDLPPPLPVDFVPSPWDLLDRLSMLTDACREWRNGDVVIGRGSIADVKRVIQVCDVVAPVRQKSGPGLADDDGGD